MGVNLLVTTKEYNLPNITIVDSLLDVDWETVDCLIFNSSIDDSVTTSIELAKIGESVDKIIYINMDINPLLYSIFNGFEADIYDSEDALQDWDILEFMIESYKETGMTMSPLSEEVDILARGITALSTGEKEDIVKLVNNNLWVQNMTNAVESVSRGVARTDDTSIYLLPMLREVKELVDMMEINQEEGAINLQDLTEKIKVAESMYDEVQREKRDLTLKLSSKEMENRSLKEARASEEEDLKKKNALMEEQIELYNEQLKLMEEQVKDSDKELSSVKGEIGVVKEEARKMQDLLKKKDDENQLLRREKVELEAQLQDAEKNQRSNTPFSYMTVDVPVTVPKVLQIKAYGNCRYLNSFIIAYQNYLKMSKQVNCKVLFIIPKLERNLTRFGEFPRLAVDSISMIDLTSSIYVTFDPKKAVMDKFFSQQGVHTFIVVDLLFGKPLVKGHMVETLAAVSGLGDVDRFGLDKNKCIFTIDFPAEGIKIPYIPKYMVTKNEQTRKSLYFQKAKSSFEALDKYALRESR